MKNTLSIIKKFLISNIVIALAVSMLAGCGKKDESEKLNIIDDNYRNYYEIYVHSFYDSNEDGIGDLNGVTQKLDYLKDLGINGIWLMPIMPSPTYHKYDVVDYMDIDSEYGTMEDFDKLVEECHKRGINIIIDMVMNHSSSQNEWFVKACDYLRTLKEGEEPDKNVCPYVSYYNFSKEKKNEAWYSVEGTDWYYEGVFWSEMPDLNLEDDNLRKEFETISDFWIEHGVDGYRMDAAMHYEDDDQGATLEIMNWIYSYCLSKKSDFYMVSEVWANKATIAAFYKSMTPSMFNFAAAGAEGTIEKAARGQLSADGLVNAMIDYQTTYSASNPDYIDAPFITNHDQVRVANNLNCDTGDMKMAAGILMTMSGSTFIYYGEEIGMKSQGKDDPNKRLPMNWSYTDPTGVCDVPEGADNDVEQSFEAVDAQLGDEMSLLNYYKRALKLRNMNPEIARGTITREDDLCSDSYAAIKKTWTRDDETGTTVTSAVIILYNTSDEAVVVDLTADEYKELTIAGYLTLDDAPISIDNGKVTMPPQSICVFR
ncbi:Glycosidase [Butyrivibrio fibrisolvens]|uniref:Glycosidase n=1 Tax=Butyrivibrio fibrisolvens TaxID=831 RepID=A0A1H9PKZ7_BUTFI|nr:alpha-amylase family glycosyl hydrolase [Butyrivibrio fibrisolvens]SER48921.1 Glycosidase [Butyrivibrio fibrisolvens]